VYRLTASISSVTRAKTFRSSSSYFRAAVQRRYSRSIETIPSGIIREPQNGIERAMAVLVGPVRKAPADLTCEDRRQGLEPEKPDRKAAMVSALDKEEHKPILSASADQLGGCGTEGRGGTAGMKRSTLRFCMQKLGASEQRVPAVDRADQPNSERSNTAG
jgi:hypothetical protein